jgi:cyclic pyranopterin phosphate synthase
VTSRCNLHCSYCRSEDLEPGQSDTLTDEEMLQLVQQIDRVAAVGKVRLTGGEPLHRPRLPELVRRLRRVLPAAELCLTTNGTLLTDLAAPLRQAGIDAINISLDAVDQHRYRAGTGGGIVDHVLAGLEAASAAGFARLKINAVLQRSINADELVRLVRLAHRHGGEMRFIELMPIGIAAEIYDREYLPADEALARICAELSYLGPLGTEGTARLHRFRDDHDPENDTPVITIGFITPISHPFCDTCNRVRLDCRGHLRSCLRLQDGLDLATPLREGQQVELERRVRAALREKCPATESWPDRPMSAIGG